MSQQAERSGRCLCRCVSYTFRPAEPEVDACHCSMCQRWSGGPSLSVKAAAPADVTGREVLTGYRSSEWGERHFCRNCGSHRFYSAPTFGYFGVSAGIIDDLGGLTLTTEIFIDRKPDLYAFANASRQLTEAEFLAMISAPPAKE
jgi:hypothetical protein